MTPNLFYLKIIFYLFVSVLIFETTQMVAVEVSQMEHNKKPLRAKVYCQEDVSELMVS